MVSCVSHTTVVPLGQVLLLTYGQVVAAMCIVLVLCIEFDCSLSHLGGWFTSDISQQLDLRDRYAARSDLLPKHFFSSSRMKCNLYRDTSSCLGNSRVALDVPDQKGSPSCLLVLSGFHASICWFGWYQCWWFGAGRDSVHVPMGTHDRAVSIRDIDGPQLSLAVSLRHI